MRRDVYQQVLDLKVRKYGPHHSCLIATLVRLADDTVSSKPSYSADLLSRAIAIGEHAYGQSDTRLVPLLMNLAHIHYYWSGNYDAAERTYIRALEIVESTSGSEHWNVVQILGALGGIYAKMQRWVDSEHCYRRVIALEERVFGAANFRTLEHREALEQSVRNQKPGT